MAAPLRRSVEFRGYALALAATVAALLLQLLSFGVLGNQAPFFPFVLAVLVTAWYGGLKPGLLATALGILLGIYFASPPAHPPLVEQVGRPLAAWVFALVGLLASWLCGKLRAANRRAEEKQWVVEQAEELIRSVVNNVVDGIITADDNGTVLSFNPAAERMFGYTASKVIGRNVKMLMLAPSPDGSDRSLADLVCTEQAKMVSVGEEVIGRRKDGSTFPMDLAVSGFVLRLDLAVDGFVLRSQRCFTAIVRDITERKRAAEALKEADRRKDEFLAILAHELRNPLAPLRSALDLLHSARDDPTVMEQVRSVMERQVSHMGRLIDDLLDISRITSGKLDLRKERVELAVVVPNAVEVARPLIEAQAHELTVVLPAEAIHLHADPVRLAQVFSNLLNNAAKYTLKGGHLWLTAEQREGEVVISVRDTGIGIATEQLTHLFKMFSQITPALERSQGGLGIGLALVRGLVELHGGRVEAYSAGLGKGSTLTVRLPAIAVSEGVAQASGVTCPNAGPAPKCRILLVDDLPDTVESMGTMLRLAGHDVQTAHDGLEAVQAAATFRPDVVILDIGLPKMNGYEAARHIREQPWGKRILLIALSGWGQDEDKRRAAEAGFNFYLTKPVEPTTLEKLLASFNRAIQH
jgi:PAS domain S-box-containing protein